MSASVPAAGCARHASARSRANVYGVGARGRQQELGSPMSAQLRGGGGLLLAKGEQGLPIAVLAGVGQGSAALLLCGRRATPGGGGAPPLALLEVLPGSLCPYQESPDFALIP